MNCRNCNAALRASDRYCSACGQETALHPPSAWEFLHEFVDHYVALDGKVWRTLGKLLFRPGELTTAHLEGQRNRYIRPLRLYLSASIVFFVIVKIFGDMLTFAAPGAQGAAEGPIVVSGEGFRITDPTVQGSQFLTKHLRKKAEFLNKMDATQQGQYVQQKFVVYAPYAMFILLPLYAWLLKLAYVNRRRLYGEHLVFALHAHAFLFTYLLLASAIPWNWLDDLLALAVVAWFLVALRTVYGGRWWTTLARGFGIGFAYLMSVAFVVFGIVLFAILA